VLKTVAAIAVSALIAGALVGFPDIISPVSATSTAGVAPIAAPACPERGWPYNQCGAKGTAGPVIRLVTTDRLK
jgi:hypothetical protein